MPARGGGGASDRSNGRAFAKAGQKPRNIDVLRPDAFLRLNRIANQLNEQFIGLFDKPPPGAGDGLSSGGATSLASVFISSTLQRLARRNASPVKIATQNFG